MAGGQGYYPQAESAGGRAKGAGLRQPGAAHVRQTVPSLAVVAHLLSLLSEIITVVKRKTKHNVPSTILTMSKWAVW